MARRIVFLLVAILIAIYYRWTARASGTDFLWGYDHLDGYYNFLSRAFARGHFYLELQPSRELLAQPDPWDPNVPLSMKWHDMVLYGGRYYLYCRQQGLWPKEVLGRDPDKQPCDFDPFCPVRNVTAGYPPTLLLHGDEDTDVPYEQSVLMADTLACAGVEHQLLTVPGGGHGFDGRMDEPVVSAAFETVLCFLGGILDQPGDPKRGAGGGVNA